MNLARCFCLFVLLLAGAPCAIAQSAGSQWEVLRGSWEISGEGEARSRLEPEDALVLTRDWYGDFEFSGTFVILKGNMQSSRVSLPVRYAADSESYFLEIDIAGSRALLRENHFGESREAVAVPLRNLKSGEPIWFRISARGNGLTATLGMTTPRDAEPVVLSLQKVSLPEGRLGLAAFNCEVAFSALKFGGRTDSTLPTYAFRCNYQLNRAVAGEPLWEYLDSVGSSLKSRFRNQFASVEEFEKYRQQVLIQLRRSLGLDPWPDRAALNPRVVGVIDRSGYTIEKVIFESHPGFPVNALVYVPKGVTRPAPGILSTIGHYGENGFYVWSEQARAIGLAKKGYVVLTYDPISQGERQWLGSGDHNRLRRIALLTGLGVSGLLVWDSIRAIDYLTSRPDVDSQRIGVTGLSGGGFNALLTATLDERVKAVAPAGFATTIEALVKRGKAGCCAYLPNMSLYADYGQIHSLIAPRHLLILGGYMDELSDRLIQVYETARPVYKLLGADDNIKYFLDEDSGHTYSKPLRLALYRWFNKWLRGIDDPGAAREPEGPEAVPISKESGLLKVFPDANRGKDVIDLLREYLAKNRIRYETPGDSREATAIQNELRSRLIELMGDPGVAEAPLIASDSRERDPSTVRQVVLETQKDLPVPVAIHHPPPNKRRNMLVVYFSMSDPQSSGAVQRQGSINALLHLGVTVAVPQVRGSGSTQTADMNSVALYMLALSKHLFATRIYDLQRVIDYVQSQSEYRGMDLVVWGEGAREGLMSLYMAAIDSRIHTVVSSQGLVSYQSILDENHLPDFDYYVPSILRYADVPQLIGAIAPRRVIINTPTGMNRGPIDHEVVRRTYAWAEAVYRVLNTSRQFSIVEQHEVIPVLFGLD